MPNINDAIDMTISDPNELNDATPIIKQLTFDERCLIFKKESVFELILSEHNGTSHTAQKILDIGTKSPCIARIILQFEPMIKLAIRERNTQKNLIKHIWKLTEELATCYKIVLSLEEEINALTIRCRHIIEQNRRSPTMPSLPIVRDLETKINTFLISGKKFLTETFKIFSILFNMTFTDRNASHFDNHVDWIINNLGETHNLSIFLQENLNKIRIISEARNAMEHSRENLTINIKNFRLTIGNELSQPTWSYNLTSNLQDAIAIDNNLFDDIDKFLFNLLAIFEISMLYSIKHKLDNDGNRYSIIKYTSEEINDNCPIHYFLTFNFYENDREMLDNVL